MESKSKASFTTACMSAQMNNAAAANNPISKTDASSTLPESKRHCSESRGRMSTIKTAGSPPDVSKTTKPHGKSAVSDEDGSGFMLFSQVTPGPHEAQLRFRLIHLWEARNPHTKTLIGEELLLIDEQGTAMQGFIPAGRVQTYLPRLKAGSVYMVSNFFGGRSKNVYRVAEHDVTIMFSWNTVFTVDENNVVPFPDDRFRFHTHEEFQADCDLKEDLYDFVGHMKLVNGQSLTDGLMLDEVEIEEKRHVLIHVQIKDGPVMKLYLWDKASSGFCQNFKSYGVPPTVILVTTLNPKRLGGTLALTSMSSSRVFMHTDVQPTRDYLSSFSSNPDIASNVNAEVVTKPESVTIRELFSYMKQESAKFECTATIDDVLQGSAWYYISCGGCNSKATKMANTLVCTNKKCRRSDVTGVAQYLARISVYDMSEQATFVILGDAGRELTGKHAAELVANYFESNADVGADGLVPIPQALLETIGQTHKFLVKVSDHNLTGKSQSLTVTKVLARDPPENDIGNSAAESM